MYCTNLYYKVFPFTLLYSTVLDCVVLCYSVALHDLVAPALGSIASLLRAPVLCCTPVSPSGVIEVEPSAAARVTRRKVPPAPSPYSGVTRSSSGRCGAKRKGLATAAGRISGILYYRRSRTSFALPAGENRR